MLPDDDDIILKIDGPPLLVYVEHVGGSETNWDKSGHPLDPSGIWNICQLKLLSMLCPPLLTTSKAMTDKVHLVYAADKKSWDSSRAMFVLSELLQLTIGAMRKGCFFLFPVTHLKLLFHCTHYDLKSNENVEIWRLQLNITSYRRPFMVH